MPWVNAGELVAKSVAVATRHGDAFIDGMIDGTLGIGL